ncbi:interleukin 23 p19 subunit [Lynx pardinus]|uniref:Interleukin-23 subunit alpha n=3 Tax=Felinae TaxID=338152 RepID=A0ABI7ZYR1_FELCA|nr:interleukin-23 subunit alpha isoform X3 [Felis catus]XP_030178785.1 interleukin-23 subunit alpha [Lynx canadensis]XP_046921425.1 interleukin-23 subunit alpha [Lynx rufus]XP_047722558.1 interleukin-23 subunit alpha [Prionailurus viverrinus]XP_058598365.1 interleukin-23 subunit alpha isoform X2 [Neofelis nebulosa]VFV33148.1 interleukin 23 p19 subunit [Lynx pardinus]
MLGSSRAMLLLLLLLLPPLPWTAQTRAVPEGSSPAWALGQQLSQKLCTLAWSAHPPTGHVDLPREQGDDETTDDVPHIQCGDGCDPQGLRDNSQFCLQRIHQGLVFYEKLLGSDIFTGEPSLLPDSPVGQLHASLLGLRQLLQPDGQHWETEQTPNPSPNQPWQRLLLRFKILRSLQAFVAVAARVFAHGAATLSP